MVLWVPQKGIWRVQHNTGDVGYANVDIGTPVITGATSSTKGAVAELISSTLFDAYKVVVVASGYGTSAISSMGCLDILIGASAEEVLISNLLMGFCGSYFARDAGPKVWEFPLYIPAGSRLSARAAGERTSASLALGVMIFLYGGDGLPSGPVGGKVTTYGVSSVPAGTTIVPGANTNEGSWVEITSSTTSNHIALIPSFQNSTDTSVQQRNLQLDVGIGSATEEPIGGPYWYKNDTAETLGGPFPYTPIVQNIPSGTRLVMRASSSGPAGTFNGAIHAVS